MVTLSACHTGVNTVFPGDELHGLMRGFLYAGAPSLVASLWAANDLSTAEFMARCIRACAREIQKGRRCARLNWQSKRLTGTRTTGRHSS